MGAPSFAPGTLLMASLLTVLTSAQGLLTAASKSGSGYAYDFATVPFLAELTKLAISWALLVRARRADPGGVRVTRDARHVALFIVPSIIYMFHNNVQARAARAAVHTLGIACRLQVVPADSRACRHPAANLCAEAACADGLSAGDGHKSGARAWTAHARPHSCLRP